MSEYWRAIILAVQQGYSADLERGVIFGPNGKPLSVKLHGKQKYPTIRLHVKGLPRSAYSLAAHKFIGYLIWGEAALAGRHSHVRHLNPPTTDIRRANLALGTPSQNELDKPAHVRSASAKAARAAQGKTPHNALLASAIAEIKEALRTAPRGPTGRMRRGVVSKLATKHGVSKSTISLVGSGKTWI